mgnify:CR=1 FL=1
MSIPFFISVLLITIVFIAPAVEQAKKLLKQVKKLLKQVKFLESAITTTSKCWKKTKTKCQTAGNNIIMNQFDNEKYERAKKKMEDIKGFYTHLVVYLIVNSMLILLQLKMNLTSPDTAMP